MERSREAERGLERQVAKGIVLNVGWIYHCVGRAWLLLDRLDEARRLARRAVESSLSQPGYGAHSAHSLHLLGDIATHPERFDAERGETHYRQALALAEPRGMRPLVAHCHLGLGKLYGRTGKREQAHEHLTTAETMYREMDVRFWLEQAGAEIEELPCRDYISEVFSNGQATDASGGGCGAHRDAQEAPRRPHEDRRRSLGPRPARAGCREDGPRGALAEGG
jgi:tetratricopeptide (TPR) repeat protein